MEVSQVRTVVSGSLLECGQELLPLPIEDEPLGRLREEEDDQHAGSTDHGDAQQEVLILMKESCNQSS